MKTKILVLFLLCAVFLSALPIFASAEDGEDVYAEIDAVYGGRRGMVTLTFDDGNYDTVLVVDELLEKYDLTATVMMIGSRVKNGASKWIPLFETGRLAVQNHSMNHIGFRETILEDAENLNPETYKAEIIDSKTLLETVFPGFDMVSYAIPYGGWCDEAAAVAAKEYYMIRSTTGGVQNLDPGFELNVNGSWSNIKCVTINTVTYPTQLDKLKEQVDEAALGGWLCTITHHVGSMDAAEMTYDDADKLFEYISDYEKMGVLWVTDTESATKYLRERQNATLTARKSGANISLCATLADQTEDGLPLDEEIFDYPLTVKVEVGEEFDTVYYYDGCEERTAEVFSDGGKRYARVELVPNGEELLLYPSALDVETLPHDYAEPTCTEAATCKVCGHTTGTVIPHDYADATCTVPMICNVCGEYSGEPLGHDYTEATCTSPKICIRCEKVSGKAKRHEYLDATCTEPKTCENCGATEGEPFGHVASGITCADVKCARCKNMVPTGIAHDYTDATCTEEKTCKVCGATDGNLLAHDYRDATCTEAKTCENCGATEGDPLGHDISGDTCTEEKCARCEKTVPTGVAHDYAAATCTAPKTCKVCEATEGDALGHDYSAATCTAPSICARCAVEGDKALGHSTVKESTGSENSHESTCTRCHVTLDSSEPHTDENSDGKCDGCAENLNTGGGEDGNGPSLVIIITVSCGVIGIGGGAAAVIIIRKKRSK